MAKDAPIRMCETAILKWHMTPAKAIRCSGMRLAWRM